MFAHIPDPILMTTDSPPFSDVKANLASELYGESLHLSKPGDESFNKNVQSTVLY